MSERVDRVKALLREYPVLCSLHFYRTLRPNDRNAMTEIKREGWIIETEIGRFDCGEDAPTHAHHRLRRDPEQLRLEVA